MNFYSLTIAVIQSRLLKKIVRVMKVTSLILLIGLLQVSATGLSQKIDLNEKNSSLEKVFKAITDQSGYHFFYDSKDIFEQKISVSLKGATIDAAITACLKNTSLGYKIIGNNVILRKEEERKTEAPKVEIAAVVATITGKVTDTKGAALQGVTIFNKDNKRAAITQADGSFQIVADKGDVLQFSSVGYQSKDVIVGSSINYHVVLAIANSPMEQVVVVGYGSLKRKDLTGAVSSVSVEEVRDIPFTSVDQALAGKAAGVQVVQADGSPGGVASIRVRGGTSIMGGNDPLYIIDGVQVTPQDRYIKTPGEVVDPVARAGTADDGISSISGGFSRGLNSLSGLNISDIESIDILKDASATAIYGSKAANGVVIITTKKGNYDEKPIFQLNNYTGFSVPIKSKLLNASQYTMIMKEAAQNLINEQTAAGEVPDATASSIINDPEFLGTANTDWLDLVLRNGLTQNTDISVRGGGKKSRYYTSISYSKQAGVVKNTDFSRLSGKINLDNEISKKFRFMINLDYGFTNNNITNGAYSQALYAPPTVAPYNSDGTYTTLTGNALGATNYSGFQNPLLLLNGINLGKNAAFLGSLALEYKILPDLKFRSQASLNYNLYRQRNYTPSSALVSTSSGSSDSKGGVGSQGQTEALSYLFENTLNYSKEFNADSRLDVVAGTSWQQDKASSFQASGQTYPDDRVLNNLGQAAVTLPNTSSSYESSLLSFYLRANYTLKDRYIVTVTGRSDASSKFAPDQQVGYFPSAGLAWRMSQEKFLRDVKWLDELKLRASAGYTGTQNIGNYLYRTLYTTGTINGTNAVIPTQLGNDKIKWENTLQKDAGVDISLFKSRLNASVGVYEKQSSGLLFTQPLPSSSSYSTLTANLADIRNRGIEIALQGTIIQKRNFSWRSAFNLSSNKSLVTNINKDYVDPNHGSVMSAGSTSIILSNTVLREGYPVGQFVGSRFTGIIQDKDQLAAYQKSYPYSMFFTPYMNIGDPMYYITDSGYSKGFPDNYQLIGSATPKFYGGFTNTFSYKNISLTALLTYSYGGNILYMADVQNQYVADLSNKGVRILDRWTPTHTNTDVPRLIYSQNGGGVSSSNIYSSSYLKLKSVTLNYQFSDKLMKKLQMQSAMVYVSATNLFTVTKYPGQDPEVSNDPYSLINGYTDANAYPSVKQYIFGLRVAF